MDTTYDKIFAKITPRYLPLNFLRCLAKRESGLDPLADAGRGKKPNAAKGLFQITGAMRIAYNKRTGKVIGVQDLYDPEISTKIAVWGLLKIMLSYARNHPQSLRPNFSDPRWVAILVQGWNAGYSESGGVGKVVSQLEQQGCKGSCVTVDKIHQQALIMPTVSKYLKLPDRARWAKSVATDYSLLSASEKRIA